MKRDERLRGLSDDHHQALVLARRAIQGALNPADAHAEIWEQVRRRFEHELEPHFRIEEDLLLPALIKQGHVALAERTRKEHVHLRELVCAVRLPLGVRLVQLGEALRAHIRFEERELFPVCQQALQDSVLKAVLTASKRVRNMDRRVGSP